MTLDKMMQVVAAATIWMNFAAKYLKENKLFYKQKNKNLLNALVFENSDWIKEDDKIRALLFKDKDIHASMQARFEFLTGEKYMYDRETVEDNITVSQDIFSLFISIFLACDNNNLVDFYILLNNFNDRKRLYSEKDLKYHLEAFTNECVINYKINPSIVEGYVEKLKPKENA
jgi:hypothetical protein